MKRKFKLFSAFLVLSMLFTSLPAQFMEKAMAENYDEYHLLNEKYVYCGDLIYMYTSYDDNKVTYKVDGETVGEDRNWQVKVKGVFEINGEKK